MGRVFMRSVALTGLALVMIFLSRPHSPAHATTTFDIKFTAEFTDQDYPEVSGEVLVTFDPAGPPMHAPLSMISLAGVPDPSFADFSFRPGSVPERHYITLHDGWRTYQLLLAISGDFSSLPQPKITYVSASLELFQEANAITSLTGTASASVVPVPAAAVLLGGGLIRLVWYRRRI